MRDVLLVLAGQGIRNLPRPCCGKGPGGRCRVRRNRVLDRLMMSPARSPAWSAGPFGVTATMPAGAPSGGLPAEGRAIARKMASPPATA